MGRVVTLGEIMLRLSTDVGERINKANHFHAHYGGGEANVAISLANFGHEAIFASKVPDNSLGRAVQQHLRSAGVDTRYLLTSPGRLGTYYLEAGVGERAAEVIYDRAYSSFSLMTENQWLGEPLFSKADIFHVSGITPALSETWQHLLLELIHSAKEQGCLISFDINYRGKLWSQQEAGAYLKKVLPFVDYCSAGELDARYLMEIPEITGGKLQDYYSAIQAKYPNIKVLYSTKRTVYSASSNDLVGTIWEADRYYESKVHHIDPIVDRVGGGDAFSAGILHGLLTEKSYQDTVDFATAASALKHTVHGDDNQFTVREVEGFLAAGSGKIQR